jgi:hypothetical protein
MRDLSTTGQMMMVSTGRLSVLPVATYAGLDRFSLSDAEGQLAEQAFVAIRQGDDLVVIYADGTQVIIEGYFTQDTTVVLDAAGGPVDLAPMGEPIGTIDGVTLHGYGGRIEEARAILRGHSDLERLQPVLGDDSDGGPLFLGAGSLAGALGLAAFGGSSAAVAAAVATAVTVVSGTFVAGPVVPGNGLVVDIYDAQGRLLRADVPLDENGFFSVTLQGTFPNVIAILRDTNQDPDYRDEATGNPVDLNANLAGIGTGTPQPGGTTTVSLNINPVTTLAARLAGVGADGSIPQGGIDPAAITQNVQRVQDLFGLEDINGVAPTNIFDEDFDDTDGNVDAGEVYGQVLAMLSGKDKLNGGDQQQTIEDLLAAITTAQDETAAQEAVRQNLFEGAREFEFNNDGGTENDADLLRSPSLGVERTPEVGGDGRTTEPQFAALLEDALKGESTGAGPNEAADTIEGFQALVDTADAVQSLAALETGAEIPQTLIDQLTEENLTALGLTGLTAPSPYLDGFLEALRDAAPEGADSVAELQALLDGVLVATLTPTTITTPNADGTISVSGQSVEGATVTVTFPDGTTGSVVAGANGAYGPITSTAPQTTGNVVASAVDGEGNASPDRTSSYTDTTAPLAPSITEPVTVNADGTLSVSGTGEPGTTATVTFPDGTSGTATVGTDGSFGPVTSAAPQTSGTVEAIVTDAAGNASPADSSSYTDSTAPLTPSITEPVTVNPDGTLSVSGTGEPGTTATVTFPDGTSGTATVGTDGSFGPVTSAAPQTSGTVEAIVTDAAGNASPADSSAYTDSTAPLTPSITEPVTVNPDGTLSVSGTGEPGTTATVTFPDGTSGTATVGTDGSFGPVTSAAPQTSGTVEAIVTDAAGNASPADSSAYTDSTAPLTPSITEPVTVNPDGTLSVSGTGEPGTTATVTFPDGTSGTATVGTDGSFGPVTSTAPQTSGTVSAIVTDAAGNASPADSSAYTDSTAPLTPSITEPVTVNPDGTLSVSGTGEPGTTATVTFPDGTSGTATVGTDGSFGPVTSAAPQTSGTVEAIVTDAAGNASPADSSAYTDSTAPLTPSITEPVTVNPDGTLSVSGTGEPGTTATVTFPDGTSGTATVGTDGSFGPVTSAAPQTSGTVEAIVTDAAGNASPADSSTYTDSTAPLTPSITEPVTVNPDGTLSVSGTGEPGTTATVTFPDGTSGTATVGTDGSFGPVTSAAPQTSGTVEAIVTDAAGNASPADSSAYTDTTAPLVPLASSFMSDVTGVITTTGTAEPGSNVTVTFPDGSTATVTAALDGSFTVASGPNQPSGNVVTTARDAAGNTSAADSDAIVDNTPPAAPTINPGITDQANTVTGTGEAGATLLLFNGGTQIGTTIVASDGTWSLITAAPVADGAFLTAQQIDASANASPLSAGVTTFTDTDGDGLSNSGVLTPQVVVAETFDNLTQGSNLLSTGTAWVFASTDTDPSEPANAPVFWASDGSIQLYRNPAASTLTQSFTEMTGGSTITVNMGVSAAQPNPAVITVEYNNVVYATITTGTDNTSTGIVTASNGATVSWPGSTGEFNFADLVVTLPDGIATSGDVVLRYSAEVFGADDYRISAITVTKAEVPLDADVDGDGRADIVEDAGISLLNAVMPTSGTVNDGDTFTTADGTQWTVGGTAAASGSWISTAPFLHFMADGIDFRRDTETTTTVTTTLGDLEHSDGKIVINGVNWFNSGNLEVSNATATFSYAGVDVLRIDLGLTTATVTALNGASSSVSALPAPGSDIDIEITLPSGYANGGDFVITFVAGTSAEGVDDLRIGGVTVPVAGGGLTTSNDVDGDGIINSLDIDADGDRIWDKYETGDTDGGGIPDYLDTDSNGNGISDTVEASLTAADIAALVNPGTATERVDASGTYTNGDFSNQFILLTEAVDLDFTAIANTAFADVEYIDMRDGGTVQSITLNEDEVIALTDADNELIIVGDAGDTVNALGFVDTGKDKSIEGRAFNIYESANGATLIIDDDITNIVLT